MFFVYSQASTSTEAFENLMPKKSRLDVDYLSNQFFYKVMAKTDSGKKKVYVHTYTKKLKNGETVKVSAHYRSTPN